MSIEIEWFTDVDGYTRAAPVINGVRSEVLTFLSPSAAERYRRCYEAHEARQEDSHESA